MNRAFPTRTLWSPGRPSFGARRVVGAALAGAGIAGLALSSTAAAQVAPPVRITGVSQEVHRGSHAFVDFATRRNARCLLQASRVGSTIRTRIVKARASRVAFSWTVPTSAAAGPSSVTVRCAVSTRRLRRHARTARTVMDVIADKDPAIGALFRPRSVRVRFRARRTSERVRRGLPSGIGDPNAVTAEAAVGTGGAGYGTFWPLSTGVRTQITQGQKGGDSHDRDTTLHAIDLGVPTGTEIRAGFNGVVARINRVCAPASPGCGGGFGNYVLLKAPDGTCALHAHLSRVDVEPSQPARKYTLLGLSGYSGSVEPAGARGAHLHYDRVVCNTFASLPWAPAEGGALSAGRIITSQNAPDVVCLAPLQGSCVNPQETVSPQPGTVNPQPPTGNPQVPPPVVTPGSGGTAPPLAPPPPPTYAQTTGGVTNTWTNYTNAGGTQGPTIPKNATVAVSCKVTGFRVADGNTWWYRIASSPWNNAFYASADAFYNNGQTSGTLAGTPFVDPNVRDC